MENNKDFTPKLPQTVVDISAFVLSVFCRSMSEHLRVCFPERRKLTDPMHTWRVCFWPLLCSLRDPHDSASVWSAWWLCVFPSSSTPPCLLFAAVEPSSYWLYSYLDTRDRKKTPWREIRDKLCHRLINWLIDWSLFPLGLSVKESVLKPSDWFKVMRLSSSEVKWDGIRLFAPQRLANTTWCFLEEQCF